MDNEKNCSLNYKAEYERLMAESEKAKCEMVYLHERNKELERENKILTAQMNIVYLIFRGRE